MRLYVKTALWAATLLAGHMVPILLLAEVGFAVCLGAICHALTIKFTTWLYRKGNALAFLRWLGFRNEREQFALLTLSMAAWYLVAAVRDHRPILNIAAIEAVFGLGVWLYLHRGQARSELGRQLRRHISAFRAG